MPLYHLSKLKDMISKNSTLFIAQTGAKFSIEILYPINDF